MFAVPLSSVFEFYLILGLGAVALCWGWVNLSRARRMRARRKQFLVCSICGVEFVDRSREAYPACPHCGSLNERTETHTI